MLAFFAATPYQLLTALQLRTQLDEAADLYLIEFNAKLARYADAMRPFFERVTVTNQPMAAFTGSGLSQLKPFLHPQCELIPQLIERRYRAVYSTRIGLGNTFYLHFIRKGNPRALFYFYDEGVANYCLSPVVGGKAAPLRELLGYPEPCARFDGYLLYHPELLRVSVNAPVPRIPPIRPDGDAVRAFALRPETRAALESADVLYFDAPVREQLGFELDTARLSQAMAQSPRRVAVKLHPSQSRSNLCGDAARLPIVAFDEPWEVCMQLPCVERMTLMGINTTALLTPKLLYDQEPRVILLWRLFAPQWELSPTHRAFFDDAASLYRDQSRFQEPQTWEELARILERG